MRLRGFVLSGCWQFNNSLAGSCQFLLSPRTTLRDALVVAYCGVDSSSTSVRTLNGNTLLQNVPAGTTVLFVTAVMVYQPAVCWFVWCCRGVVKSVPALGVCVCVCWLLLCLVLSFPLPSPLPSPLSFSRTFCCLCIVRFLGRHRAFRSRHGMGQHQHCERGRPDA